MQNIVTRHNPYIFLDRNRERKVVSADEFQLNMKLNLQHLKINYNGTMIRRSDIATGMFFRNILTRA